jgi:hypothetical protein
MMGECFTRNMYSRLQGIKYCTKKCHIVGTLKKPIEVTKIVRIEIKYD